MKRLIHSLLLGILAATPTVLSARWTEARSPNFIVYSEGSANSLRDSASLLEEYDQLLRTLTGTTAPPSVNPLKIYLVGSNSALRKISSLPPGAVGFYSAYVGGTAAFAVRRNNPGPQLDGQDILLHEYAHHFMSRYYPAYYPTWYSEGFAEYVMTARIRPDRIEVGRYNPARALSLLTAPWLPVERILTTGRAGMSEGEISQFYAQSWLIVHYLFAAPDRQQALTRYLADLNRGTAERIAFQNAFGKNHQAFESDLKRYMQGSIAYGTMGRRMEAAPPITLTPLPPSADDLLLPMASLTLGAGGQEREKAIYDDIRKAAARFPDDPYARRVLGRAEINSGDRAAGVAMIETLLEASPRDAELLYYRGTADFYTGRTDKANRAAHFAAARVWFARAVEADPYYYTALYRLAITSPRTPPVPDETIAQFVTAHRLAPLVGDIAIDAATALMTRQRYPEAAAAILPIANNPHGRNSKRATELLEQIRTAMAAAPQP